MVKNYKIYPSMSIGKRKRGRSGDTETKGSGDEEIKRKNNDTKI
jgi:hypothetical protein